MLVKPFKTIVVGVDFSPYSKVVVKQAELLCHLWGSYLVLVHAVHDPVQYGAGAPHFMFPNLMGPKEYSKRIKSFYKIKNTTTRFYAERGVPSKLIPQIAKKFARPLIMVGYKGHNPVLDFFFGSTAQSLALKSKIPVWIHRGNRAIKPDKVLVPHDLSRSADKSIDIVKKLSLANPTSYEVYYVNQKPFPILNYNLNNYSPFPVLDYNSYENVVRKKLKKTRRRIKNLLSHYPHVPFVSATGETTEKIAKESRKFDLLVMSHHNPTSFLSKGETTRVIKRVNVPILVTH